MKITDIQCIELAGPEFSAPIRSAWTPAGTYDRAGGTIVRINRGQTTIITGDRVPCDAGCRSDSVPDREYAGSGLRELCKVKD